MGKAEREGERLESQRKGTAQEFAENKNRRKPTVKSEKERVRHHQKMREKGEWRGKTEEVRERERDR